MSSLDLAATSNGIGHVTRYVLPMRSVTRFVASASAMNEGSARFDAPSPVNVT